MEGGNSYVIAVKRNQPKLYTAIEQQTQTTKPTTVWSWKQHGHGHNLKCRIKVYPAPAELQPMWAGLHQVISVNRPGQRKNQTINTTTYYITSESRGAYALANAIRGHRRIENNLHWVKDVIFNEDNCGIRHPQLAATLGVFRDMSFNLLIMNGFRSMTEGIQTVTGKVGWLWQMITLPREKVPI